MRIHSTPEAERSEYFNCFNWSAPASVQALKDSGWHVQQIRRKGWQAGHFRLTGHGDVLDAGTNRLPSGRTVGRALRAFRRKLQRDPVAFA